MNTSEFLMIASAIVPDRTALIFDGEEVSFADFQERVNRLANALSGLGVGAGDRLAIMQVNCTQGIEIYFAAAQLDAIYVPINFRAKTEELRPMLRLAEPRYLFIGERYLSLVPTSGEGALTPGAADSVGWRGHRGQSWLRRAAGRRHSGPAPLPRGERRRYNGDHVYRRDHRSA